MIVTGGLGLRLYYVLVVTRHENAKFYDANYYLIQSLVMSTGHFFPVVFGHGPDAAHPPLTAMSITPATYLFGLHPGYTPQRLTMAVLGAAVVLFVGILGRALAGPRVGLLAAAVAAVYPNMWIPNGIIMSETLTMLVMALILLAAYRLMRAPTWGNAVLLGLGCGVEILVRAELILLLPFLLVPAALTARNVAWRRRLVLAALGIVVAGLVVGPWVGRNLVSFRDTTILSTGEGPLLLGANCPKTYSGPLLGFWNAVCSIDVRPAPEQSVESTLQYDKAKSYMTHHLSRLPVVALARVGRVWDFYEPLQMVDFDVNEGRPIPASFAGLLAYWVLLPFAVVGAVALRRRRLKIWPFVVVAGLVTVIAATGYGAVRFRAEFEVPLVILAATGLAATGRTVVGRFSPSAPPAAASAPPPVASTPAELSPPG
jgi:4-amino-4-deoxy-L-arabinose transferase-like glycosyltransferase